MSFYVFFSVHVILYSLKPLTIIVVIYKIYVPKIILFYFLTVAFDKPRLAAFWSVFVIVIYCVNSELIVFIFNAFLREFEGAYYKN